MSNKSQLTLMLYIQDPCQLSAVFIILPRPRIFHIFPSAVLPGGRRSTHPPQPQQPPQPPPLLPSYTMSGEITLSCPALAKMLLHAARYPQTAVSGVVLAPARGGGGGGGGGGAEGSSSMSTLPSVTLMDAVPLFHLQLCLAPMLEVALTQIEQRYKSEGLVIAGYYQANEHIRDNVPDFLALKVAEKIAENNNDACLIMVDNKRLCLSLQSAPIIVSQLSAEGKWRSKDKASVHVEEGTLEVVSTLLQRRVQHDVSDFDNHLDDLSCDWSNPQINKLLTTLTAAAARD
ncbi:hypothetical protein Pcinc_019829 [Petrolisthes cinctipes]|uniref:MPN domain-containing protein n=1 Tax=Petrolisthes cinctipes TaxID=88211 RepID=A0AAE1FKH8_PETCI|nr:hypothetical protein Pcinc_019829 [Petrolisthes cinctipes]